MNKDNILANILFGYSNWSFIRPDVFDKFSLSSKIRTFAITTTGKSTWWRTDMIAWFIVEIYKLITTIATNQICILTIVWILSDCSWWIPNWLTENIIDFCFDTLRNCTLNSWYDKKSCNEENKWRFHCEKTTRTRFDFNWNIYTK